MQLVRSRELVARGDRLTAQNSKTAAQRDAQIGGQGWVFQFRPLKAILGIDRGDPTADPIECPDRTCTAGITQYALPYAPVTAFGKKNASQRCVSNRNPCCDDRTFLRGSTRRIGFARIDRIPTNHIPLAIQGAAGPHIDQRGISPLAPDRQPLRIGFDFHFTPSR